MANSKRECKYCKEYSAEFIKVPAGTFCTFDHALKFANEKQSRDAKRARSKADRKDRATTKQRKKELMTRTEWYNKLQTLVNQYVKYRDRNEPCCTCGTTNPNIKYDAGHFFTRAARPDIRFELTNIHIQCSMKCNQHGSGMRAEYTQFIIKRYGADHLAWLESEGKPLKEQFPSWENIEKEIIRYRKLLRACGIGPHV